MSLKSIKKFITLYGNKIFAFLFMTILGIIFVLFFSGKLEIPFLSIYNHLTQDFLTSSTEQHSSLVKDSQNFEEEAIMAPAPSLSDIIKSYPYANEFLQTGEYALSENVFSSENFILAKVKDFPVFLPSSYSFSKIERTLKNRYDKTYSETIVSEKSSVWPRMEFIFIENEDGTTTLLYHDMTLIFDVMPYNLKFVGERDLQGRALFLLDDKYVYWSKESNLFLKSNYDPKFDHRNVHFDYPSYFAAPDSHIYISHTLKYFGYSSSLTGGVVIARYYDGAFQFTQGFAAMYDAYGDIIIRDKYGYEHFTHLSLCAPKSTGIESLGYYIFEHGLARALSGTVSWRGTISNEKDIVISVNGDVFPMPEDYNIISYSNGIFLLEKNGLYGYYSHTGRWICDPIYTYAQPFIEGLGVIGYADGKKGAIDTLGTFVIPRMFDEITNCSGGVIALFDKESGWTVMNKLEKIAVEKIS